MIDLNPHHLATVKDILAEHVPRCEVQAFGSRVTWTAKDYSDLDLVVIAREPLDQKTLGRLQEAFQESDLPMRVDVLDWHNISPSFRQVIAQDYVVIKEKPGKKKGANPLTNPVDIQSDHLCVVQDILREHLPADVKVWVFGSRANWTTKDSSDLDLALEGAAKIDRKAIGGLENALENSDLPYSVDIVDLSAIGSKFKQIVESQKIPLPMTRNAKARSDRKETALGDVVDLRLSSVDKKTKPNETPVQLCNYTDVYNNRFIHSGLDFMAATATDREISKCSLIAGDVVITKDSEKYDDIGVPALVREDIPNLVCGYHLAILRPSISEIDGTYLFYALSTDEVQRQFHSYANGVTRFGLRKTDIGLVRVPCPSLTEQQAIARILSELDSKIELNRRMNETLAAMAQALFKSWLVDFDPVRAKMEGHDTGLPPDIAALFPNQMMDSELGEIPEGWDVKALGELVELAYGKALKADDRQCGNVPVYGSNRQIGWHDEKLVAGPGIVVGRKGNPGIVTWVQRDFFPIDTTFYVVPRNANQKLQFLFFALATQDLPSVASDSAVPGLNRNLAYMNRQIVPDNMIMKAFNDCVEAFFTRRQHLEEESRILAAQRDELLPKLISGEIHVCSSKV